MKIYNKVVIDLDGNVLEEDSFEYEGELALCGGSGGGSSGRVEYPPYVQNVHAHLMFGSGMEGGRHEITTYNGITEAMDITFGLDPYGSASAYNPDTYITSVFSETTDYNTLVDLLSNSTGLDTLVDNVISTTRITEYVDAFTADFDANLNATVYPRFEAGMRDINAVMSSAFAIGRANIEESRNREIAKMDAQVRLQAFGQDALQLISLKLEAQKALTQAVAESRRLAYVMKKEQTDKDIELNAQSALWDIELFQYGANLLAAPGGGTMVPGKQGPSKGQSALGGAMSGAATGAQVGGGYGAVAGAIIGGVAGYASA